MKTTWTHDRFYWSVIDLPGWTKSGVLPPALQLELQNDVPVPVEELHAVCIPIQAASGGGAGTRDRVLVCAARRDDLAALAPGVLYLSPSSIPECIGGLSSPGDADAATSESLASRLNVLVGEYEPRPFRHRRLRKHLELAATFLVCAGLVSLGLLRRADSYRELTAGALQTGTAIHARPANVEADVARLTLVRDAVSKAHLPPDAALTLAAILRTWPMQTRCIPQSVTITPNSVAISVTTAEEDSTPFFKALTAPPGWKLEEPRMNSMSGPSGSRQTRIMVELRPLAGPARKGRP